MSAGEDDTQGAVAEAQEPEQTDVEEASVEALEQIRTLDFSQPTKFTTELRRRIARSLDLFVEGLTGWMVGRCRP